MALSFTFDAMGQYEKPIMTLCNPQRKQLDILGLAKNTTLSPLFNGLSELSFMIPYKHNRQKVGYYNRVVKNRLIKVEGFGWFIIVRASENNDGAGLFKQVYCLSYESTLNRKAINLADGTYQFWNPISPSETLLGKIIKSNPSWQIGYVSSELWSKFRTFEIPDTSTYAFLMNDVVNAYECIFDFDTETKTINAYTTSESMKQSDIFLSLDNLIKEVSVETTDDPIVTVLNVIGDSTLDISSVNPMGTNSIYNFNYVKNEEWMSVGLINALTLWQDKFNTQQPIYADLLSALKTRNSELIVLNGELVDLQSDYNALEQVRTARIAQSITDLSDITNQINQNLALQNAKKQQISNKNIEIDVLQTQLKSINDSLKFENNFSVLQLQELDNFITIGTFQNENFGILSDMSAIEIQELAQQLYNQGVNTLKRLSQPSYTFDVSSVNFLFLKKYQTFISQIRLGTVLNLEVQEGLWIQPVLLKIDVEYDNPNSFNLTFSNRLRLQNAEWTFAELQNDISKTSGRVGIGLLKWNEAASKTDEVTQYMNSALDLTNQAIQNADNQTTLIDQFGYWGRRLAANGSFEPEQIRMTNNVIGFTQDNWQTLSMAVGKIPSPYGNGYLYGVVGQALVGNLIAGNNLLITNENNYFRVDASGATLYNAALTLLRNDNRAKITLDPADGIKIQTYSGGWRDSFYVDNNGTIVANDIITNRGTIGGWRIENNGLFSDWGDYIRSDGRFKISLLTATPTSAVFDGNIYARNLLDQVQTPHVANSAIINSKIGNEAVSTSKVQDSAITPTKLDRVYATQIVVDNLAARVATIERLYVSYAEVDNLIANYISSRAITINNGLSTNTLQVWGSAGVNGELYCSNLVVGSNSISLSSGTYRRITITVPTEGGSSRSYSVLGL